MGDDAGEVDLCIKLFLRFSSKYVFKYLSSNINIKYRGPNISCLSNFNLILWFYN